MFVRYDPFCVTHFLLDAVFYRMTSLRKSNGGEPRPSKALDTQSTSSKNQRDRARVFREHNENRE